MVDDESDTGLVESKRFDASYIVDEKQRRVKWILNYWNKEKKNILGMYFLDLSDVNRSYNLWTCSYEWFLR